jgi:hypothetical protein
LSDLGGEQVPATRHGFEQLLIAVVEGAAKFKGALHQGIVGDERVGPDGLHQFLFADQSAGVFDEVFESPVELGAEFDFLYSLENTPLGEVQGKPGKLVA